MKLATMCVICGRFNEDDGHLFFKYKHVLKLWSELILKHIRECLANALSAREVVEEILTLRKEVQHQVIIYYITSGQEDVEFMKEKGKGMQWVWNNLFGVM